MATVYPPPTYHQLPHPVSYPYDLYHHLHRHRNASDKKGGEGGVEFRNSDWLKCVTSPPSLYSPHHHFRGGAKKMEEIVGGLNSSYHMNKHNIEISSSSGTFGRQKRCTYFSSNIVSGDSASTAVSATTSSAKFAASYTSPSVVRTYSRVATPPRTSGKSPSINTTPNYPSPPPSSSSSSSSSVFSYHKSVSFPVVTSRSPMSYSYSSSSSFSCMQPSTFANRRSPLTVPSSSRDYERKQSVTPCYSHTYQIPSSSVVNNTSAVVAPTNRITSPPSNATTTTTSSKPFPSSSSSVSSLLHSLVTKVNVGDDGFVGKVGMNMCEEITMINRNCVYCGNDLRNNRHFHPYWPAMGMCNVCRFKFPKCCCCERKAVSFICPLTGRETKAKRISDVFQLCGRCNTLKCVKTQEDANNILFKVLDFLESRFNVSFNDEMFENQRRPIVQKTLEISDYFQSRGNGRERKKSPSSSSLSSPPPPPPPPSFSWSYTFPIQFKAVDFSHINNLESEASDHLYGRCECRKIKINDVVHETTVVNNNNCSTSTQTKKENVRVVHRMMVVKDLPEIVFAAHLAHEVLHAYLWLVKPSFIKLDRTVEEGLCNVISAVMLQNRLNELQELHHLSSQSSSSSSLVSKYQNEKDVCRFRLQKMEQSNHPHYGVGYRLMLRVVNKLGFTETLKVLRLHGKSLSNLQREVLSDRR